MTTAKRSLLGRPMAEDLDDRRAAVPCRRSRRRRGRQLRRDRLRKRGVCLRRLSRGRQHQRRAHMVGDIPRRERDRRRARAPRTDRVRTAVGIQQPPEPDRDLAVHLDRRWPTLALQHLIRRSRLTAKRSRSTGLSGRRSRYAVDGLHRDDRFATRESHLAPASCVHQAS